MNLFFDIIKDAGLVIMISIFLAKIKDHDQYSAYRLLIAVFLFFI